MGKPKRSEVFVDLAVKLYEEIGSGHAVAKRLDVSPQTVYRALSERGVYVPGWKDEKPSRRALKGQAEQEAIADYLAGMDLVSLESKYRVGQYAIRSAIKRAGHKLRDHGGQRRRVSAEEAARMAYLYETDGLSQAQIAAVFGAHQTVVSKVLRERGVATKRAKARGANAAGWQGGLSKTAGGYIIEHCVGDPICGSMATRSGYAMQHRLVMARHLGRPLMKAETVHHINGDKTDNRVENLQLRHGKHGAGEVLVCADCGSHNIVHKELP